MQKAAFLAGAGDRFYARNRARLARAIVRARRDDLLESLRGLPRPPRSVLEIGCSTGWRLDAIRRQSRARCVGIDPSAAAIARGGRMFDRVRLLRGTAEVLPFRDGAFDLVIHGFCLYLCDPQDHFRIAYETDRVLCEGGHLALLDFHPAFPYRNHYRDAPGLYAYKMDYSRMFTWHPAYVSVSLRLLYERGHAGERNEQDERVSVVVLRKALSTAYVTEPWRAAASPPAAAPRGAGRRGATRRTGGAS